MEESIDNKGVKETIGLKFNKVLCMKKIRRNVNHMAKVDGGLDMRMIISLLAFVIVITSSHAETAEDLLVIPKPRHIERGIGNFIISGKTRIGFPAMKECDLRNTAQFLSNEICRITGLSLGITQYKEKPKESGQLLMIACHPASLPNEFLSGKLDRDTMSKLDREGYFLEVSRERVVLYGASAAGAFYAAQTFLQLVNFDPDKGWSVPSVRILDQPAFSLRGQHFDLARRFRPAPLLKQFISLLARYKMNILHLHFTDDQSWTLESKKYKLTKPGKFYSQEELKDLVSFAEKHFVTIIPEIDLPGHSSALRGVNPRICCGGGGLICPGNEETYKFLEDIFAELCPIFKGPYFHTGGDEVYPDPTRCPACSARLAEEHLSGQRGIYFYFFHRVEEILRKHGKRMIIWWAPHSYWEHYPRICQEPEHGTIPSLLSKDTILQKYQESGITPTGLRTHIDIINSEWHPMYISHNKRTPLDILKFYPYVSLATPEKTLGIISCSWGDRDEPSEEIVLFPRVLAVAEKGWVDESEPEDFMRRLSYHFLDIVGQIPKEQRGRPEHMWAPTRLIHILTDPEHPLKRFKRNIFRYIVSLHPDMDLSSQYVKNWMVIGPFDNTNGKGFDAVYPPEKKIDYTEAYAGKTKTVSWFKYTIPGGFWCGASMVDPITNMCAYAHTILELPDKKTVLLCFGCDDTLKVWVNGQKLLGENVPGVHDEYQYVVPVTLSKGKNEVLAKICREEIRRSGNRFSLQICNVELKGEKHDMRNEKKNH